MLLFEKGFGLEFDVRSNILLDLQVSENYPSPERSALEVNVREAFGKEFPLQHGQAGSRMDAARIRNGVWHCNMPAEFFPRYFVYGLRRSDTDGSRMSLQAVELPEDYVLIRKDKDQMERYVSQLTRRERELLPLLLEGKSNREIGAAFYLSPHTVDNHRANVYRKLEVQNVKELIRRFGVT